MKKIYLVALMSIAGGAFAQTGKVGINATSPAATLDIQPTTANADPTATTNEGILIPRLTAARVGKIATRVEGTMVYVTDAPSGALFSDTTKGFYYWDPAANTTGQWVKMGSGGAAPAEGTFTRNLRIYNGPTETMTGTDYFLVNKYVAGSSTVTFPASPSNGRTVCVMNTNTTGDVLMSGATVVGPSTIYGGYTGCWIYSSADSTWYTSSAN